MLDQKRLKYILCNGLSQCCGAPAALLIDCRNWAFLKSLGPVSRLKCFRHQPQKLYGGCKKTKLVQFCSVVRKRLGSGRLQAAPGGPRRLRAAPVPLYSPCIELSLWLTVFQVLKTILKMLWKISYLSQCSHWSETWKQCVLSMFCFSQKQGQIFSGFKPRSFSTELICLACAV